MLLRLLARERGLTPRFREVPHDEVLDAASRHHRRAGDRRRRLRAPPRASRTCSISARAWRDADRAALRLRGVGRARPAPSTPRTSRSCSESLARRARRRGPTIARAWAEAHGGDPAVYERYLRAQHPLPASAPRSCRACRRSSIARAGAAELLRARRSAARLFESPRDASRAGARPDRARSRSIDALLADAAAGERLSPDDALRLYAEAPALELGAAADARRQRAAPRRRGHLHHRPQRQLHERLRHPLQVLQLLPAARPTRPRATCCRARSWRRSSRRRSTWAACRSCCRAGSTRSCRSTGTRICSAG